jgi:large subunit ribosomal protein L15
MLDRLSPRPGARHRRKRVGRGPGSGWHKTSGRGVKGQGKRSAGRETPLYFEGGQMPMVRRLPKRGFTSRSRLVEAAVNVRDLAGFAAGATVDPAALAARGLVGRRTERVKLLGEGEAPARLTVRVHGASASARRKVEGAGGSVEIIA